MLIEVDKQDLINLVKGTEPSHELMKHPLIAENGRYTGGFHDKWDWNYRPFRNNTEEEIYQLYIMLKNE